MDAMAFREWIMIALDTAIVYILIVEYYFDKKMYESKRKKIKRTKDKVVVSIVDGQAVITEQPSDINVVIENPGQDKP